MPAAVSGATGPTQGAAANPVPTGPVGPNGPIDPVLGSGGALPDKQHKLALTEGWFLCIACVGGYALANTPLGPFVYGVLSIALLYQITNLIEGK